MKKYIVMSALIMLSYGCATSTTIYMTNKKTGEREEIAHIKQDSHGLARYMIEKKNGDKITVEVDTREGGNWWTRNVVPIFQRGVDAGIGTLPFMAK